LTLSGLESIRAQTSVAHWEPLCYMQSSVGLVEGNDKKAQSQKVLILLIMTSNKKDSFTGVAITGLGAVTPYGSGVDRFWKAITAGNHAFVPIELFDAKEHRTSIAAEIRRLPELKLNRLDAHILSRCDLFALKAASEALVHARRMNDSDGGVAGSERMGLVVGSAAGAIWEVERFFKLRHSGPMPKDVFPLLSSFCLSAMATNIAREFDIRGPRTTLATVCSSSGLALAAGMEMLETHDLEAVLVVGAETLSQVSHSGFNSLRSIAPERCQPFDLNRKGLILGEGAGAMVLERTDVAQKRGAPSLVFLRGYGLTTDTHHFTAPEPEGQAIAQTISLALAHGGVRAEEIQYINAHGTGTKLNDVAETRGIKRALGVHAKTVVVSSTKSMIGHQMGAASILEGIATVMTLTQGLIHPTANLETPDPECDLDYATDGSRGQDLTCAMSNSFAFGGSNISLIFSRQPKTLSKGRDEQPVPVITGIGIVSPLGLGKVPFRDALAYGKSGITSLESVGDEWLEIQGGLVDIKEVSRQTPAAIRRRLNRQTSFLWVAFNEAVQDSGMHLDGLDGAGGFSIVYGSAFGCSGNVQRLYSQLLTEGPRFVSPMEFNMSVTNAPPSLIAQELGLNAPIWVLVADEASWDLALHWATRQIRNNRARQVAVCAADEISDSILAIHQGLGILETKEQRGLTLGEGAVCMIIEAEKTARDRGAKIYGTITGCGSIQDTSCGPQDFSKGAHHLVQAARQSVEELHAGCGELMIISPENGNPAVKIIADEGLDALCGMWKNNVRRFDCRSVLGESGTAGGLGLAAAILNSDVQSGVGILVLTCGRGGINAASFVQV
jgi:3-oxoacyl-[acyl-carrier-protein] synthase II